MDGRRDHGRVSADPFQSDAGMGGRVVEVTSKHAKPEPEPESVPMSNVRELLDSISWRATRYAMDGDRVRHDAMMEAHTDIRYWLLGYQGNTEPCDCMERHAGCVR